MKFCLKCLKYVNRDYFHKNKNSKDGLVNWCKKCRSKVHRDNRLKVEMAIKVLKTFEKESPEEYKRIMGILNAT